MEIASAFRQVRRSLEQKRFNTPWNHERSKTRNKTNPNYDLNYDPSSTPKPQFSSILHDNESLTFVSMRKKASENIPETEKHESSNRKKRKYDQELEEISIIKLFNDVSSCWKNSGEVLKLKERYNGMLEKDRFASLNFKDVSFSDLFYAISILLQKIRTNETDINTDTLPQLDVQHLTIPVSIFFPSPRGIESSNTKLPFFTSKLMAMSNSNLIGCPAVTDGRSVDLSSNDKVTSLINSSLKPLTMGSAILCTNNRSSSSSSPGNKQTDLCHIPTNSPTSIFTHTTYSPSLCQFTLSPTGSESPTSLSQEQIDPNAFMPNCKTPNKTYSSDWNRFPQSTVFETCDGNAESFEGSLKNDVLHNDPNMSHLLARSVEVVMDNIRNKGVLKPGLREVSQQKTYQMSQISKRQFLRTKLCPFLNKGKCANGKNCSYAHATEQLRPLPDLRQTKLCDETKRGRPCENPHCTFAHAVYQLKPPTEDLITYKTTMCFFWKKGKCFNGEKCRFAHGTHELRCFSQSKPPDRGVDDGPPDFATGSTMSTDFSSTVSSLTLELVKTILHEKGIDVAPEEVLGSLRQLVDQTCSFGNNDSQKGKFQQNLYNEISMLECQQQVSSLLAAATEGSTMDLNNVYLKDAVAINTHYLNPSSLLPLINDSVAINTSPYTQNNTIISDKVVQDCNIRALIMATLESLLLSHQNC